MNSTVICRACGHEIDSDVDFCYFCGADMAENDNLEPATLSVTKKEATCPVCRGTVESGAMICGNDIVYTNESEDTEPRIRKKSVPLKSKAAGYYCRKCELYIGVFEPRTVLC